MTALTKYVSLALALALVAFGRDEYTRTFEKTLTLHGGERVRIEHKFGDVTIRTHPQPDVAIRAEIRVSAGDSNEARDYANRVEILVEPSSSEVSIRTRYPDSQKSFFGSRNVSFSVRYEITIPENSPLEVRNAFGSVSVTGMRANSDVVTSHAGLTFRDGRGRQQLENSFGSVEVANNNGDVTIETGNAAVDASDINGALTVHDRFASVTAARVSGAVSITNGNGAVQVSDVGGSADIRNSFGEVTFSNIGRDLSVQANNAQVSGRHVGGSLAVVNSFGAVEVKDVAGAIHIQNQNGAVEVASAPHGSCQPIDIRTSFSAIRISLPPDPSYRVSAKTSFGSIRSDFPLTIQGSLSNDEVNGAIGHGGCDMRLTDNNGAIEIAKR